jgi:hypothetical protein
MTSEFLDARGAAERLRIRGIVPDVQSRDQLVDDVEVPFPGFLEGAADDRLALLTTRWTGRGTHEGELMSISPTGKRVTVSGLTISRLEGDKIVEEFQNWDTFGMMQQLEAVPALAQV